MTSKSKTKGNTFERQISKFLGETLGGNFMRVPNSGAFQGGRNAYRKKSLSKTQDMSTKGDIIPPDNLSKLNIEAKNYQNIAFHQIINGECKQLDGWIEQTEIVAGPTDISFTIFKITRKGSWVVFRESLKDNFTLSSYVIYNKNNNITYIITDYESFFIDNKEKILEIGQ
jgi:hypothetical protein